MGARRQHMHDTLWVVKKRKRSTCDAMAENIVQTHFLLHIELPTVSIFHSELFIRFEFECAGPLRSLVEGRKSNKLFKRSVRRVSSIIIEATECPPLCKFPRLASLQRTGYASLHWTSRTTSIIAPRLISPF